MSANCNNEKIEILTFFNDGCKNYIKSSCCRDFFGNEISVGDYVVAHIGEPKRDGIEGIVSEILEYDCGSFIKISTLGGKVIAHCEHPKYYAITQKR